MEHGHEWVPKPTEAGDELRMMVSSHCGDRRVPVVGEEACFATGLSLGRQQGK